MTLYSEPSWGESQQIYESKAEESAFLNTDVSPLYITGYLLQFLKWKFHNPDNIQDEQLKGLILKSFVGHGEIPPDGPPDIRIQESYSDIKETKGTYPGIFIRRGGYEIRPYGLLSNEAALNVSTGSEPTDEKNLIVNGSHTIITVCRGSLACDKISDDILTDLKSYHSILKKEMSLAYFLPVNVGEPTPVGGGDDADLFYVSITCSWTYHTVAALKQLAPFIQKIKITGTA